MNPGFELQLDASFGEHQDSQCDTQGFQELGSSWLWAASWLLQSSSGGNSGIALMLRMLEACNAAAESPAECDAPPLIQKRLLEICQACKK